MVNEESLKIKVGLLVNGVDLSDDEVVQRLDAEGKLRAAHGLYTYRNHTKPSPNEIILRDGIRAEVRSRAGSLFKVCLDEYAGGYVLKHEGKTLPVDFPVLPVFYGETSLYGTPLFEVVQVMGEDNLRIYPDLTCAFDKPDIKCNFCGLSKPRRNLSDEELKDEVMHAVTTAMGERDVNHVFMASGAYFQKRVNDFFSDTIRRLREEVFHTGTLAGVFALAPPADLDFIDQLFQEGGIETLSFNLEAWDPDVFATIGNGKTGLGQDHYMKAYERAVLVAGRNRVKSNFVGGLEPLGSLLSGIETLAKMGVSSSMTVYYPTPGSPWETRKYNPLCREANDNPTQYFLNAYRGLRKITDRYGLTPSWCRGCRISGLEWDVDAND